MTARVTTHETSWNRTTFSFTQAPPGASLGLPAKPRPVGAQNVAPEGQSSGGGRPGEGDRGDYDVVDGDASRSWNPTQWMLRSAKC